MAYCIVCGRDHDPAVGCTDGTGDVLRHLGLPHERGRAPDPAPRPPRVETIDETSRSLAGAGILAAWTLLPVAAAIVLRSLPVSLYIALWWVALVFPHGSVVFQPPLRPLPVFDMEFGAIIAIVQWAVVAFVFGYLLRNRPLRAAAWLAPLVVVGVGLLSRFVFYLQGWQVRIEGP